MKEGKMITTTNESMQKDTNLKLRYSEICQTTII